MERIDLAPQMRDDFARVMPSSVDEDKRTVEIVWTTGEAVRRRNYMNGEWFDEELSLDPAHVKLERLNRQAPLLNSHNRYDLQSVIGVVERAWLATEKGVKQGRAIVRFSDRSDVEPIWQDVRNGILSSISAGYRIRKFEREMRDGQVPLMRATDWEPFELSFVAVGAEAGTGVRSQGEASPCEVVNTNEGIMNQPNIGQPGPAGAEETRGLNEADVNAVRREAIEQERKRAADIRQRCAKVGLDAAFADGLVERGVAVDVAADQIIDELARRGAQGGPSPIPGGGGVEVRGGYDATEPTARRAAMAEAIAARHAPGLVKVAADSRAASYRGWSVLDMAVEHLGLPSRGLSRHEIAKRALATNSDFPLMLENALNKTLLAAYEVAAPTYRRWAAQRSFKDFRAHPFYRAGDFPDLLLNGEGAEVEISAPGDSSKETVTLLKYGRRIALSREVLVNDDLGGFMDLGGMAGRRIADKENALVYAQLALNTFSGPTLRDTYAVFASQHANKAGSGTTIDVTNVAAGRAAIRKQTSAGGLKLNLAPTILLTGPDRETLAQQFLNATVVPATDATANPFKGTMQAVADANITGNYWFLFADPNTAPVFIYGYLEDMPGPQVETKEGWTTDGVEYRAMLYFGTGAIDYRGGYQNAGA